MSEKIIGIIPSRYSSTRLLAKPLIDLCGKTMIERVYEGAKNSKLLDKIIVATDDERIANVVKKIGGDFEMTPPSIQSGSDRVAFVSEKFPNAEIVVNIQGDETLLKGELIDELVFPMLNDNSIQVATPIKKIEITEELFSPNIPKVIVDKDFFAIYFSRFPIPFVVKNFDSKELQKHVTYYKHIGIYAFRNSALKNFTQLPKTDLEQMESLEQLRMLYNGWKIKTVLTNYNTYSVDTYADADVVREILRNKLL